MTSRFANFGPGLLGVAAALAAAWLFPAPAAAQVRETLATQSSYAVDGYAVDGYAVDGMGGGEAGTGDRRLIAAGGLALDYASSIGSAGDFAFHHDLGCGGACSASVTTWLTDTFTNTGPDAVDVGFVSGITAGHLDAAGADAVARFVFTVMQGDRALYAATGLAAAGGATLWSSGGSADLGGGASVAPGAVAWGATPLRLALGSLAPGESTTVSLELSTLVSSAAGGRALLFFGDPRDQGAPPIPLLSSPAASGASLLFDDQGAPPVPEPAAWLLLIAGLGLTGAVLRRPGTPARA